MTDDRFARKFKKDDVVRINHNGYHDFPEGTIGKIDFVGILHNGVPTYHVCFISSTPWFTDMLTMDEPELEFAHTVAKAA